MYLNMFFQKSIYAENLGRILESIPQVQDVWFMNQQKESELSTEFL